MSDRRTTREDIEQLMRRILASQDDEIDCEQVAELIAHYVELEVAGHGAPQVLPQVYRHLVQCNACAELRDVLYQLVVLEESGALPDSDTLLDEIVTPDLPSARPVPRTTPPVRKRPEGQSEDRLAGPSVRRPEPAASPAGNRRRGETHWGCWAAVVLIVVVAVLLGVWLLQNRGPLSLLYRPVASTLAAVCDPAASRSVWGLIFRPESGILG